MRVMIVEDEAILALALIRYLESRGHEVVAHCYSGEDALERLSDTQPEIVLMDLSLQGNVDGLEAGKVVLEKKIPLVIVSAHTDQETIDSVKAIGCRYHLVKPINYNELDETMKSVLNAR